MHNKINLDKKNILVLIGLAEGIKVTRSGTGIADLLDLASRLNEMAKACDDRCKTTVAASVNGCWFTYPNANVLVTKAGLKVEAEANRLVSSTMHLVEDLFTGHCVGQVVIGGLCTDLDGDTNEGADQEVFDRLNEGRIPKYMGSVRIPTGSTSGVNDTDGDTQSSAAAIAEYNNSPNRTWETKVVRRADSPLTGNEWANLAEKGMPGKKANFWK